MHVLIEPVRGRILQPRQGASPLASSLYEWSSAAGPVSLNINLRRDPYKEKTGLFRLLKFIKPRLVLQSQFPIQLYYIR